MSIQGVGSLTQVLAGAGVSTVDRTSSTAAGARVQGPPPPPPGGGSGGGVPPHVEAAAEALGLSTDDVVDALQDGSSLADLAEEQGVSRDDLVAALVAAAPEEMQDLGNLTELTEGLVDQKGLGRPAGPPPVGSTGVFGAALTEAQGVTLDSLAALIGTGSDTLVTALQHGTSLASLLTDAGVSVSDIADAVQQGLLLDTEA